MTVVAIVYLAGFAVTTALIAARLQADDGPNQKFFDYMLSLACALTAAPFWPLLALAAAGAGIARALGWGRR